MSVPPLRSTATRRRRRVGVETLEDRRVLSTISVTSLAGTGPGSLRWAIVEANASPGPDEIDFAVSGTIHAGRSALPAITGPTNIDGTSAPGFAGTPVVTVDLQGARGLRFARGADGSTLSSLSLVRSGGDGVTIDASNVTVQGNYIGLLADGSTIAANRGDGVRINAGSRGNLIGREIPATSVTYGDPSAVPSYPVTGWQGLRGAATAGQYLFAGTSGSNGLLYVGPITAQGGSSYLVNYPGAVSTSVYGPDLLPNGDVRLVGSFRTGSDVVSGFVYEGAIADLGDGSNYRPIAYPGAKFTYVHSTMGGVAVGNYDGPTPQGAPVGVGRAFVYNLASSEFTAEIAYPGAISTTAYGVWYNGGTGYTITGGYTMPTPADPRASVAAGFLVDYDSATGAFTNWKSLTGPVADGALNVATHFEGISSVQGGVYTLAGSTESTAGTVGSFVTVRRNPDSSFDDGVWQNVDYPAAGTSLPTSVYGDQLTGLFLSSSGALPYQASVSQSFQLSNVISGNCGNGVGVYGASDSRIAMNFIGTDASGTQARGNRGSGILLTKGAARNTIGGRATGGNDPTGGVFVRPPQGNLISGNRGNGVLINGRSTRNVLSGNFVGTDASGNAALGNRLDGVAIDGADGNDLIGCTIQDRPFVFYNVLSGNGGNGLRVTNSNDVTVHANFMGVGANNGTIVANRGDGLLVSGRSQNTQVGGVIPLGNVISGNDRNGIEVRDQARGFISFNTFGGVFAFGGAAPNRGDGILITSSGGDNQVRTSIISGNLGDGIELGGRATGVQITDTATGTDTAINAAIPNGGSGIKLSGRARGNAIGGFQPSVEPRVTTSANGRYGIEVVGSARDNIIFNTYVGTGARQTNALGNALGGVYLGPGTSGTSIGGTGEGESILIANNGGDGVTIVSARNGRVVGNRILGNAGYGLRVTGDVRWTVLRDNQVADNAAGGVDVTDARGVVTT